MSPSPACCLGNPNGKCLTYVKPSVADASQQTDLVCSTFEKSGNLRPESRGSCPHGLSICLQIQKPVVNTNVEKLAQELEELAQTQVRKEQGRRSQGEAWVVGEGRSGWTGCRGAGGGRRAEAGD